MPTIHTKVDLAVAAIQAFHELGRRSLASRPENDAHGGGAAAIEAAAVGRSAEYVRKARAFARRKVGYTRKEVTRLCQRVRDTCELFADRGTAFGTSHVIRLLAIKTRVARAKLQAKVLKGGWSVAELDAEIRQMPNRGTAGRRPYVCGDLAGRLSLFCRRWRRWHDLLAPSDGERPIDHFAKEVQDAAEKVTEAVAELQTALNTPGPSRGKRGAKQKGMRGKHA